MFIRVTPGSAGKIQEIMNRQAKTYFVALLLLSFSLSFAQESETSGAALSLHINGLALHFDKGDTTNEKSWGLGIEKLLGSGASKKAVFDGWEKFWELDVYKDSYSDVAVAGGFGMRRSLLRHLDFGLKAGLLYERELKEKAGSRIVPYLLPFVETNFNAPLSLRAILVPPIDKYSIDGLIFLQLIIDIP